MARLACILLICLLLPLSMVAQNDPCGRPSRQATLDVNNVAAGLLNGGDLWWDLKSEPRYEVPKGSGKHSLFAGGLWIGGIDNGGKLRMAAQTYRSGGYDYWPGPIDTSGTTHSTLCSRFDKFFHIKATEIEKMESLHQQYNINQGQSIPSSQIPQNVKDWPAKENPFFRDAMGLQYDIYYDLAPFVNVDGKPGYNPAGGDYPRMRGDEMYWWVFNDVGNLHGESGGRPLGIEVHASAYAYASGNYLDNTTFYRFEINNKIISLDSLFVGLWNGFDLGNFTDDFVGCDTIRNMGIGYNGDAIDEGEYGYGENPPQIGVDFLRVKSSQGTSRGMSKFMYYHSDFAAVGNPEFSSHYYKYLNGIWKDGSPLTYGGNGYKTGNPTDYFFPSPPTDNSPNAWSECKAGNSPFDRRMLMSSGPFNIPKGGNVTLDFAAIWVNCDHTEGCKADFTCLQVASNQVQAIFDHGILPSGQAEISNEKIQLSPNPADDHLKVSINEQGNHTFKIYNAQGRLIQKGKFNGQKTSVKLNGLKDGFYILSIDRGRAKGKFMVQSR